MKISSKLIAAIIGGLVALSVVIGLAVYLLPIFRVTNVEITGNEHSTVEQIEEAAGVPDGANLLRVNAHDTALKVSDLPWVDKATVARSLPNTLVVEVEERVVAAYVNADDGPHLIDTKGREFIIDQPPAEAVEITGEWDFDRGFWTWRQTGGLLYRLGTLEFEYKSLGNSPAPPGLSPEDGILSVHIPSDASLSREELDRSYAWAAEFFASAGTFCLSGPPKAVLCGSWLLSPVLDGLLPQSSGIRRFAGDYERYYVREEDTSFYRWVFGAVRPAEELPEDTGLRRAIKRRLLAGGLVGMACGELKTAGAKQAQGTGSKDSCEIQRDNRVPNS